MLLILNVVKYPSPILSLKSEKVTKFDDSLIELARNLKQTVKAESGLGISAIQVGIPLQIMLVSDNGKDFITMINPYICMKSGIDSVDYEGCLSYNKQVKVKRDREIVVKFQDLLGGWDNMHCEGLLARCVLHELDHISGKGIWQEDLLPRLLEYLNEE